MTRRAHSSLAILAIALVAGGCTTATPSPTPEASPSASASGEISPSPSASDETALIPQPPPPEGLDVAPDEARVDLEMPTFSDPTTIDNPYFPVSSQESVLLVGTVEDQAFRTEVTLLPTTRILEWEGQQVEVLVSQYVAFLDGRLEEVAYDLYAQADDGSVWYFGEDVFNFADGMIVDTHGTWTAGVDGPAAMIMPADPQVGDVYRPENIPGFVFEEVTVRSTDETLDGPFGPIEGGLVVEELHMDGATEEKWFAPGYGEFYTAGGGDVEAVATAVPTDAADGAEPEALAPMADEARALLTADMAAATESVDRIRSARDGYPDEEIPARLIPLIDETIERLSTAVSDDDAAAAHQVAINLGRLVLDLELRYRTPVEVEMGRFDLWLEQLRLDAGAEDAESVNGDYFALDYVRERFFAALDPTESAELNLAMEELVTAIGDEDFAAASEIAAGMSETLAGISPGG